MKGKQKRPAQRLGYGVGVVAGMVKRAAGGQLCLP